MKSAPLLLVLMLLPDIAQAAAWTLPRGHWQLITGNIFSEAGRSFDVSGRAATPTYFERMLLQTDTQYGLSNKVTLFVRTETARVNSRSGTGPAVRAVDNAFEGGLRWRLSRGLGLLAEDDILSVEASMRKAGAFNFAYSANALAAGEDRGFRLLYGSGFQIRSLVGFVNLEAGYRWVSAPRPDQTPIDLTAGLWLDRRFMVMAQSFNLVSGPATPPYVPFRIHKLQLSGVWKMTRGLSLQLGGFVSPTGQNALDERGLVLSVWSNF